MNRVLVIGCPGSGKSTFARALRDRTGLPLIPIDRLYWNADRTVVPPEVFRTRLARALALPRWILDGNRGSTMAQRMAVCDTVFFLDYPTSVCVSGVLARREQPRPDLPWVEPPDAVDAAFMDSIHQYRTQSRPKVLHLLENHPEKAIHIFSTRAQADAFLGSAFRF